MPQLDILSFTTQIFWVLTAILVLYTVLVRIVLPDLMLITRIRAKVLTRLERLVLRTEKTSTDSIKRFANASKQLEAAFEHETSLKTLRTQVESGVGSSLKGGVVTSTAFVYSLEEDDEFTLLAPLLTFLAPTDEFILTLSFVLFFVMFYYYVSPIIVTSLFTKQRDDLEALFTKLSRLRLENAQLRLENQRSNELLLDKTLSALFLYDALYTSLTLAIQKFTKEHALSEPFFKYTLTKTEALSAVKQSSRLLHAEDTNNDDADILLEGYVDNSANYYEQIRLMVFLAKHIDLFDDEEDDEEDIFGDDVFDLAEAEQELLDISDENEESPDNP